MNPACPVVLNVYDTNGTMLVERFGLHAPQREQGLDLLAGERPDLRP